MFGDTFEHDMRRAGERALRVGRIMAAENRGARLSAIAAYYREAWRDVRASEPHRWAFDVHEVDWCRWMTPIELSLWGEIRAEGIVLYPQHPVGRFFVDFGHPHARVAIECDGSAYHLDRERDAERQAEIESYGWRVYRLTGRQCNQDAETEDDPETGDAVEPPTAAQALLRTIATEHRLAARYLRAAA